ncbi:metalloregulator ArsR/SmtB family transcription factor [Streptomyces sp. SID3343]|uniref:ArsR/SmtB family transcription factor n=1 Tax=Streptomyces sp. SID3343 TaxID=2690260 RepID=UPI00136AF6A0|nr:metalloregulator ArsR/SmtB family transcription factor [Streptomyces sp. SID3343]MYW04948.1 metalloregulator ArsR/SmtB family transcription factor [Streptomyces sp. SID3343]
MAADEASGRAVQRMSDGVTAFAREIADPTRFAILDLLVVEGPQAMSEIAEALQMTGSRVGNHLARLRSAKLVTVERCGRHAIYQLAGPHIGEALASLRMVVTEAPAAAPHRVPPALSPLAQARSCYGHLAGRLGVALLRHLVEEEALLAPEGVRADVLFGPRAATVFSSVGVDLDALRPGRRRLAFACMDWTERQPHLGGVLGVALLDALVARELLAGERGTRAMRVTVVGHREFSNLLGVRIRTGEAGA